MLKVLTVVHSLSCVRLFVTPWTPARHASLSFTISQSLLKLMSIESMMPSNHLVLCRPISSCPQSFPASGAFPVSQFHQVAKVLQFQLQHQSFHWVFRDIWPMSFRIDWFDLSVQGTLKSLLQHHSLKASILQCSAFFVVQLSHSCTTTGKTIALTI